MRVAAFAFIAIVASAAAASSHGVLSLKEGEKSAFFEGTTPDLFDVDVLWQGRRVERPLTRRTEEMKPAKPANMARENAAIHAERALQKSPKLKVFLRNNCEEDVVADVAYLKKPTNPNKIKEDTKFIPRFDSSRRRNKPVRVIKKLKASSFYLLAESESYEWSGNSQMCRPSGPCFDEISVNVGVGVKKFTYTLTCGDGGNGQLPIEDILTDSPAVAATSPPSVAPVSTPTGSPTLASVTTNAPSGTPQGSPSAHPVATMTTAPVPTPATSSPVANTVPLTEAPINPTASPIAPTSSPIAPTSSPIAPTSSPIAPTSSPVADTTPQLPERDQQWVDAHNIRRFRYHAQYNVPYSPVEWSQDLADSAKAYAEKLSRGFPDRCHIEHRYLGDSYGGENLAANFGGTFNPSTPDSISKRWTEDEEFVPFFQNGHFSQVLWRATRYVGCGEAHKVLPNGGHCHIQACRYIRPGNCNINAETQFERMLEEFSPCPPFCPRDKVC